jgi:hypothetical protein
VLISGAIHIHFFFHNYRFSGGYISVSVCFIQKGYLCIYDKKESLVKDEAVRSYRTDPIQQACHDCILSCQGLPRRSLLGPVRLFPKAS